MGYSFLKSGGAFQVQFDGNNIYSGNGAVSMSKRIDKLHMVIAPIGTPIGFPEGNLFSIADIDTIGGNAPSGTIEGVITQLNALLPSSSGGGGGGSFDGQLTQGGINVSAANPLPVSGGQTDGAAGSGKGLVIAGQTAAGVVQILETNESGHLNIADGGGSITVDATSLPLPTGASTSSAQTTTNNTLSSIDAKIPALDNDRQPVLPSMASGGNISAQTNATGTNYTAFASQACKQLTLSNQSGTTIEVRQGGAGVGFQIPTGAFYTFFGLTNSNQLEIRRVDTSNTQITITARWEA